MICSRPKCAGTAVTIGMCRRHYDAHRAANPVVPPGIVIDHLTMLRESGMTQRHICEVTGIGESTLKQLLRGGDKYVRSTTARAILSTQPTPRIAQSHPEALVPIVGIARRLQALQVIGYSTQAISELIGYQYKTTPLLIHARKRYVEVGTARAVVEAYQRLMLTPAPYSWAANRTRIRASRHRWASAMAWEGIDIDDPAAAPDAGEWISVSTAEVIAELRDLGYNDKEIARKMGMQLDSVYVAMRREKQRVAA